MKNINELPKACQEALKWVRDNLKANQQLVINTEGVKIVTENYSIPASLIGNDCLVGKRVVVTEAVGQYNCYNELYSKVKLDLPYLPPLLSTEQDIRGAVLQVVDERKHLLYDDVDILVLMDSNYTYLVSKKSCEEVLVIK